MSKVTQWAGTQLRKLLCSWCRTVAFDNTDGAMPGDMPFLYVTQLRILAPHDRV